MSRKPNLLEKLTQFVSGKGFYLVVLLCVAAIGVSGYFLVRSLGGAGEEPVSAAVGNTQMPASAAPSPSVRPSASPAVSASPSPVPTISPSTAPSEFPEATPVPTQRPAARVFTWPVNGPVIVSFSVETLAYDETMLDWRTHEGIDLAAAAGTRVLATAAGTVSEIYQDDLMGITLVIDHGDGLQSVYANLSAAVVVEQGDEVFTGDVIGAVGTTAAAESGRDAHLHFAMYQDDQPVDPEDYLPD